MIIEVSVGKLPEWYNESEHDPCLEDAIVSEWHKNPEYQEVRVTYNYNATLVRGWNDDGDLVFERDNHDLGYAFKYAQENY